jgi:hypothetical protein
MPPEAAPTVTLLKVIASQVGCCAAVDANRNG